VTDRTPAHRSIWRRKVKAVTFIKASAETVWGLLTDLAEYPTWNRFMPFMSGDLRPGGVVRAEVRFRRGFFGLPFRFQAQVLRCDECREIRWTGKLLFRWLFSGVHSFILEPGLDPGVALGQAPDHDQAAADLGGVVQGPEPSRGVVLVHQEELSGLLVPVIGWYMAPRMEDGFREMNEAIKVRVESQVSADPPVC
jgi:hypothetical protein